MTRKRSLVRVQYGPFPFAPERSSSGAFSLRGRGAPARLVTDSQRVTHPVAIGGMLPTARVRRLMAADTVKFQVGWHRSRLGRLVLLALALSCVGCGSNPSDSGTDV